LLITTSFFDFILKILLHLHQVTFHVLVELVLLAHLITIFIFLLFRREAERLGVICSIDTVEITVNILMVYVVSPRDHLAHSRPVGTETAVGSEDIDPFKHHHRNVFRPE
jgi:hypothetical protein